MEIWIIVAAFIAFAIGFVAVCEKKGGGISAKWREIADRELRAARDGKPMAATDYLTDPPKSLNYNYIDWLERELKVGKYDPDRIALGFDDTKPEPKPDAVEVNERCPCIACRSRRRDARRVDTEYLGRVAKAKPVDDSWADYEAKGGLLRRIVDNHGNWTEIRSFGG